MECELCGAPATGRCSVCGRSACERHLSPRGICASCVEALCEICGERLSLARCVSCGRLGCDSCLVQIDNVRRICRDCLKGGRSRDLSSELRRLSEATALLKLGHIFKSLRREEESGK